MRAFPIALAAFLVVAGCTPEPQRPPQSEADSPPAAEPAADPVAEPPEPSAPPPTPAVPPSDYPGVAELNPSQRRAYERGYRDCRDGRYQPGEWAEAYRIGCAAAQEGR